MNEQEVQYFCGNVTCKGYIAFDGDANQKRPAVLVVHEWWGHNEHARSVARKLAQAGWIGFSLDMYGDGKQAHDPKTASEMSFGLGPVVVRERFDAARAFLLAQPNVDPDRLAAIGYCFGGMVVLNMARAGDDLRAVASFHGILATSQPAKPGIVKAKILVLNGADDPFVPKEQIDGFEKEMRAAGANYKIVNYPGAKHAFSNPEATERGRKFNLALEYNADIDRRSWDEAMEFMKRALT